MSRSLVSVLIPVHNAGKYLRPALESVLTQTYSELEFIVVDDGSTDGCLRHIEDLQRDQRMSVIRKERTGKAATLNLALQQMRGEYFVIQDADDLSHPRRIERMIQVFESDTSLAAVFSGYDIVLNGKRYAPRCRNKGVEECRADIEAFRMPALDPTAMFRAALTRRFEFEPTIHVGQVWDYILRVGEQFPMLVLGECLYSYRIHAQSNTRRDPVRRRTGIEQVLQRAHRRRGIPDIEVGRLIKERTSDASHEFGLVSHFMESVLDLRQSRQRLRAIGTAVTCVEFHPLTPSYYKPLVYSLLPVSMISCYRSVKERLRSSCKSL